MRLFVSVANRRFASVEDDRELKRKTVEALRSGGDFVAIATYQGTVEVLVSPGVFFVIERVEDRADTQAGTAGLETVAPSIDDFDDWGI